MNQYINWIVENKNVVIGPAWGESIRITNFRPLEPLEQQL